jgi:long-chain acyl-CoA synthetase
VNTLYNGLLNHPEFAKLDFSGLLVCPAAAWRCRSRWPTNGCKLTGTPIVEGYGLSETSPVATANRCDITEFTGTIGLPLPSTEIRILDDAGSRCRSAPPARSRCAARR